MYFFIVHIITDVPHPRTPTFAHPHPGPVPLAFTTLLFVSWAMHICSLANLSTFWYPVPQPPPLLRSVSVFRVSMPLDLF